MYLVLPGLQRVKPRESYETLNNLCQKVLFRFFFTLFFFYELHIYNPIMYCVVSRPIFMDMELRQNIYFKFSHNPCIRHSINNCTIPSLLSSSLRPSSLSELNLERSERDCFWKKKWMYMYYHLWYFVSKLWAVNIFITIIFDISIHKIWAIYIFITINFDILMSEERAVYVEYCGENSWPCPLLPCRLGYQTLAVGRQ